MKKTRFHQLLGCFLLLSVLLPISGWSQVNPFELVPRMEEPPERDTVTEDSTVEDTGNPFDLRSGSPPATREAVRPVASPQQPEVESTPPPSPLSFRRTKLFIILGILILLSFLITVLRSLVNKSFRAFANENVMNQLYRDQEGRGLSPFLPLYAMFFLNGGVFLFLLLRYYDIQVAWSYPVLLVACIALVSGIFLFKHLILGFLSYTFPIGKEVSRYHFNIIIFGIVTGILLVPANIFMAYASEELLPYIVWTTLVLVILIYLYRYLRSLLIANKFIRFHFFHFFLYFCTVELAPVLFLYKLITNQL